MTSVAVKALEEPGYYGDGENLYLYISKGKTKSWVFLYTLTKNKRPKGSALDPDLPAPKAKRREMGLGSFNRVSLGQARVEATKYRKLLGEGIDPFEHKAAEQAEKIRAEMAKAKAEAEALEAERIANAMPTFGDSVQRYMDNFPTKWKAVKYRESWHRSLKKHATTIWETKIDQITEEDVDAVLKPIWNTIPEAAQRVQRGMEAAFRLAIAQKIIPSPNPAQWDKIREERLGKPEKLTRGHHPAMKYKDLPAFIASLQASQSASSLALEMTILCASRSGEVRDMAWEEIDTEERLWTIPAHRMKGKRPEPHEVPLTDRALAILETMKPLALAKDKKRKADRPTGIVFRGRQNEALSDMALTMHLRRRDLGHLTVHGFRSTFRDWVGDKTQHQREIAEMALAHKVGNAVELAYARSTALEKRRVLMRDWEAYTQSNVREAIRATMEAILLAVAGAQIIPTTSADRDA